MSGSELFMTSLWFECLSRHGLERDPHRVVAVDIALRADPGVQASADAGAGGSIHLMQSASGAALASLSNYYSSLYGPVLCRQVTMDGIDWPLLSRRIKALDGSAVLRLQPMASDAPFLSGLERGLAAAGFWTDRFFCFWNWYCPVPEGGFEVYWAQRPSRLRHTVERARRRLDKLHDWRIELHSEPGPALEAALAEYQSVYARSWKPAEPRAGFIPGLVRLAAEQGWLRLGLLRLDGEVLAAQLWLVHGSKANIFKLAYVSGHERLSPGSVLTAWLMRHVMEFDHVREVDFLSGDDAYKQDWMTHRRERIGLVAFDPWRMRGLLAAARHYGGKLRKRIKNESQP